MPRDTLHKLAIVWLALWFGVIVPGHKRGLVLLPGGENQAPTASLATSGETCPLAGIMGKSGSCCPQSSPPTAPDSPGAPLPVTHCAVCYLTGVLDVPPPPDFAPRPIDLIALMAWPRPDVVISIETTKTYLGRAPPIA